MIQKTITLAGLLLLCAFPAFTQKDKSVADKDKKPEKVARMKESTWAHSSSGVLVRLLLRAASAILR